MRTADGGAAKNGNKNSTSIASSRYHKTSRTILSGFDDQMRTFKQPEAYGRNNLDFLSTIYADKSKATKPTHAELRSMAIDEKKINMMVKEERFSAQQERARRDALRQAQENVLQAQMEIDEYKALYKSHEVFVFKPTPLSACHDHVKEMEELWRNDVLAQIKVHRRTPSTFHRLRLRRNEWLHTRQNAPPAHQIDTSHAKVESSQLIACIAQVEFTQMLPNR